MTMYPHVFSPLTFGRVTIKNRIETPPMLSCMASEDGFITREMIEFYQSFARGGAGIVTLGDTCIDFDYARAHFSQLNAGDERVVNGLSKAAEAIQKYGARISIELNHAGRWAPPRVLNGRLPIGPSPIPTEAEEAAARLEGRKKIQVTEMNQDLIDQVVDNFAMAADRCLRAGFDMVMLHGGHGHLLAQFASSYSNKRTDSYGGSLENRARFILEVLQAIRRKVGDRLAIEYRISSDEFVPGGMDVDECTEFLKIIEDKIDLAHISAGQAAIPRAVPAMVQPTYYPYAFNAERAGMIKKALKIPVTCVGSFMDIAMAEKIIAEGKADVVAMARAQVADPEIVNKSRKGELDEVRPCLRCSFCGERPASFYPVRCTINPVIGREIEYRYIPRAAKKKRVVIIGGGPGGMEAALVASDRGHQVVLYEKEPELGGALRYAAAPPFKPDMKRYLDWMIKKTSSSQVRVKLSTAASKAMIKADKPDVIIVAIGGEPAIPDIPGIKKANVVRASEVDTGKVKTGKKVVVAGAGLTGCETAVLLAQQGKNVTLIDMLSEAEIAEDTTVMNKIALMELFQKHDVSLKTGVKLEQIKDKSVTVIDRQWTRYEIPADTVVVALGVKPLSASAYEGLAPDVYVIGDCAKPGNIMGAIHSAFAIAMEL